MATALDPDDPGPGGGLRKDHQAISYADRLKTNVNFDQRLKRNVLEILIEKTENDAEIVLDQENVARVCRSIGMDLQSQVEGYQVHHNGRNCTISVWVTKGVNLERFCRVEGINISKGVMTSMIRPAGRSDVTVTVNGLDFNTPDSLMIDYIQKFGGVIVSKSVIYCKFAEGPFKGKYSGERKYQVDFTRSSRNMGTYHYLDGAKFRVFYRGNEKTCGRCHQGPRSCPGKGLARECQQAGGERVNLYDHMRRLWADIGFEPSSFTLPVNDDTTSESDKPINESSRFTRNDTKAVISEKEEERFVGMTISNLSPELTDDFVRKFVEENVSNELDEEEVKINRDKRKIVVSITRTLTAQVINKAMSKINFSDCKEKFFGKPLYCRPLRNMTPEKSNKQSNGLPISQEKTSSTQATNIVPSPNKTSPTSSLSNSPATPTKLLGTVPKVIPGLPQEVQAKAINKQQKKERQRQKKQEDEEKKAKEEKKKKHLSAFDILMNARHLQDTNRDPREEMIPSHCTPQPWKSSFSRELSEQNRRMSFGSSPCFKRGPDQLDSPNSPQPTMEPKKNKKKGDTIVGTPESS